MRYEVRESDNDPEVFILFEAESSYEVASANHDEHGWAGIELLDSVARGLNELLDTFYSS